MNYTKYRKKEKKEQEDRQERAVNVYTNNTQCLWSHQQWTRQADVPVRL